MSFSPDVLVKIEFDMKHPEQSVIRTNARREMLDEILENWLIDQMATGADPAPAEDHDIYAITIGLQIAGDRFASESNCGNKGLEVGIVMKVFGHLSDLTVEDLPA